MESASEPQEDLPEEPAPAPPAPEEVAPAAQPSPGKAGGLHWRRLVWQGRIGPAFWTISGSLSLGVNLVLIAILVLMGRQLFSLKHLVSDQLLGGLYANFVKMDEAHILTQIQVNDTIRVKDTIQVDDTIPVVFDLPLAQNTQVVLTQDTPIKNATIYLNGIAVPLDLVLRQGTPLNISLNLTVPVSQTLPVKLSVPVDLTVPVNLTVPVDIPLDQTQLHAPFVGLREVVAPYQGMLADLPSSWDETPLCAPWVDWVCKLLK